MDVNTLLAGGRGRLQAKQKADLARERERHLTTARAVQIPKYGQMATAGRAE